MKPTSSPLTPKKLETLIAFNEENTKEKTRLEGFQKSTLVTRAGSSPLAQSLYVDIINKKRWDNKIDKPIIYYNKKITYKSSIYKQGHYYKRKENPTQNPSMNKKKITCY